MTEYFSGLFRQRTILLSYLQKKKKRKVWKESDSIFIHPKRFIRKLENKKIKIKNIKEKCEFRNPPDKDKRRDLNLKS